MKKLMDLNKETANRLWVQQFGKRQKTIDFSGREIAKAAYNDRKSAYGWNVDHILPQSRGGKTADYNLICCHILTNNEKADRFPCFKANAKEVEIQRRQNHYEIIARYTGSEEDYNEGVNFLDVAQGLKCRKQCESHKGSVFAGYVKIRVEISNESNQILERYEKFLVEFFDTESIVVDDGKKYLNNYWVSLRHHNRVYFFTVMAGIVPTKEDTQNLLDDCIALNTYSAYFTNKTEFESIQIICGMRHYDSLFGMSLNCKKDIVEEQVQFIAPLAIDKLVKINTDAGEKLKGVLSQNGLYPYDIIFTKLKKDIGKFI